MAMNGMELLHRVTDAWHKAPSDDATARRVLHAAARQLELFGIQRTTMEDVARRAGVSRVTIYRHFENKDVLVEAVVLREVRRFLDDIRTFLEAFDTDEERIVEGFAFTVAHLRTHTLLQRLVESEPELFLPQLTTGAAPLIAFARGLIVDYAVPLLPGIPVDDIALAAEIGVRLTISMILTPEGVVDLDDGEHLRALARRFLPLARLRST